MFLEQLQADFTSDPPAVNSFQTSTTTLLYILIHTSHTSMFFTHVSGWTESLSCSLVFPFHCAPVCLSLVCGFVSRLVVSLDDAFLHPACLLSDQASAPQDSASFIHSVIAFVPFCQDSADLVTRLLSVSVRFCILSPSLNKNIS